MPEQIVVPCQVSKILFQAQDGCCSILRASIQTASTLYRPEYIGLFPQEWGLEGFVIKASLPFQFIFRLGGSYGFSGHIGHHPKYGQQFVASFCFPDRVSDIKSVKAYLDRLPHIGPFRAEEIMRRWGKDSLAVIEKDPRLLLEISGVTEGRLKEIERVWWEEARLRQLFVWLSQYGVSLKHAADIFAELGENAAERLSKNPYLLMDAADADFDEADTLASKIMGDVPPELRMQACAPYVMRTVGWRQGHTCLPFSFFQKKVWSTMGRRKAEADFARLFREEIKERFTTVKFSDEADAFCYLPWVFRAERSVAETMLQLSARKSSWAITDDDIVQAEKDLSLSVGHPVILDGFQREAIRRAFDRGLSVITGGGGTGKSTICRCIHSIATRKGILVTFMTPTGAAAKVLEDKTGARASTIHRRLGLIPGRRRAKRTQDVEPIPAGLVVIDEFSMVGMDVAAWVASALREAGDVNLVLVGDAQQLPSVSPGNLLSQVIGSGCACVTALPHIYRQSPHSYITLAASAVAQGVKPEFPSDADDLFWHEARSSEEVVMIVKRLVEQYAASHGGSLEGLQVLSSKKAPEAGVYQLCKLIQQMMFVEGRQILSYKGKDFCVGDRVMQMVNNYEKDIFNGNTGTVVSCRPMDPMSGTPAQISIRASLPGGKDILILYSGDEIGELQVSWCTTVHKAQGSQVEEIIFAMPASDLGFLSRELIYTAMTRARKRLHVVGEPGVMAAVARSEIRKRFAGLAKMIRAMRAEVEVRVVGKDNGGEAEVEVDATEEPPG